jgi:hypothetical protein
MGYEKTNNLVIPKGGVCPRDLLFPCFTDKADPSRCFGSPRTFSVKGMKSRGLYSSPQIEERFFASLRMTKSLFQLISSVPPPAANRRLKLRRPQLRRLQLCR